MLLLQYRDAFKGVKDLSLDEILLTWEEACGLVSYFPALTSLSVNSNEMWSLYEPMTLMQSSLLHSMSTWKLKSLTLDYNKFSRLVDLAPLADVPFLESLHLKGNHIEAVGDGNCAKPVFGKHLQYIDLSYNNVTSWAFVDELPDVFPGLTALRFSHNPIYETPTKEGNTAMAIEEGYMFTLARIANLKVLNFSNITPAERTNSEIFYLSRIGKAMAAVPEAEEHTITSQHRRYNELCQLYGAPTVVRTHTIVNPDFLEARLIKFNFYMSSGTADKQESIVTITQEIPKGFDMYQVKGIVGRLFGLRPLSLRLIWETGEWDPVAGYEDQEEDSDEEDETEGGYVHGEVSAQAGSSETGKENGRWMRREVELEDGTRQIGFCVDGMEATVRIELLPR
jgi:tubulin-specific chaperone E